MGSLSEILLRAQQRARERNLPYEGALTPAEAYEVLRSSPGSKLVDVRTRAEWDWVGKIPGSVMIEWTTYPGGQANENFIAQLKQQVDPGSLTMFICRSGVRSHASAIAATEAGYRNSFNVLEGFQGDKDQSGHRDSVGGWRKAGLPWVQG
ncbi:MAG TPA: rhodanese-like domain-containing protein [Burkholderiales bacterium]|nr:rhodanese-like domain-containing protein [Burkholderiales bacterium]